MKIYKHAFFLLLVALMVAQSNSKALMKYAPEDANMVSYFNFKDLVKSEFFKENGSDITKRFNAKGDSVYLAFVEATGFKINEDVHELMVSARANSHDKSFVIAAKGNFPEKKLLAFAKQKIKNHKKNNAMIEAATINGVSSYYLYDKDKKDDRFLVSFVSQTLIVAGEEESVKSALKQSSSILDNNKMMSLIGNLKYPRQLFGIVNVEQITADDKFMMRAKDLINYISVSADFDEDLKMNVSGESTTEENAIEIEKLVNGMLAMARLTVSSDRDFIDFMNEIEVERDGKVVEMSVEVNQERVNKLKRFLQKDDRFRIKRKS